MRCKRSGKKIPQGLFYGFYRLIYDIILLRHLVNKLQFFKGDFMNAGVLNIEDVRNRLASIFKKYNIKNAYLFGSYARNEADTSSDIDLIIKTDNDFSLLNLAKLEEEIELSINKKVDLLTIDSLPLQIRSKIIGERIKIYG